MVSVPLALLPVIAFLLLLRRLDSFALVRARAVGQALAAGALAALVCLWLNPRLLAATGLTVEVFTRYLAPPIEELAKALFVAWAVGRARTGFLVDAAICGFAVGAGFALVENVVYLGHLGAASPWLWVVRGFGTAVMHGSTTAMFAIVAQAGMQRRRFVPALVAAFLFAAAVHSIFNHFLLPPLASTALLLVTMPLLLVLVFERSERRTREWLGPGFDTDAQFLENLLSADLPATPVGEYLQGLRDRFPPETVVDLLALLRLHLELSIRAKGVLLAREAGIELPVGEETREQLLELRHLEAAVGVTGRLALHPVRRTSARDLWQLYLLKG